MSMRALNERFSKDFLWGSGVSMYQVGEASTQNQWNEWASEFSKVQAAQSRHQYADLELWDEHIKPLATDAKSYIVNSAINHYRRYEEDFSLARKMGLTSFRVSIEWALIEPKEGAWDAAAIAYYVRYFKALKAAELEPVVTLFHNTLPTWFAANGGFCKRSNVRYFERFAQKITEELGAYFKYVITIHQPDTYAQEAYLHGNWPPLQKSRFAYAKVLRNLAFAHTKIAQMLHGEHAKYQVSVAKTTRFVYPGDDAYLSRASARVLQYMYDDFFLKKIVKNCDFIGVEYEMSCRVYGYRIHNSEGVKKDDVGEDLLPEDLQFALERLYRRYKLPLFITGCGIIDAQDSQRGWWLMATIRAMGEAIDGGVRVIGYSYWSFLDGYEWDKGGWPKRGLIAIDTNGERKLRKSGEQYAKLIHKIRNN
ncbi:glycoside hydrolase family 1 protein [Candidatus Saccharibacteria bacterium]|nr:glycoside hydrolase family 1 protein [Candidatus Saccharibacteria bacterium]